MRYRFHLQGINYNGLISILTKEVKNLKKNLAFLENKNTDLENELKRIKEFLKINFIFI
jgi:hypothetical protein